MKIHFTALFVAQSALALAQIPNSNLELLGYRNYSDELSSIWGHTDTAGREYALVGAFTGTSVVDITVPDSLNEVYWAPGLPNNWRELKVWNDVLYVTSEASSGLLIVDLRSLPIDSLITHQYWIDDTATFYSAHTLFIDENGRLFIFGADYGVGGALIYDLSDPFNPTLLGSYQDAYIHDGFVRGDTLWAATIYNGEVQVVDVSDPANPVKLSTWKTPSNFTHNVWPNREGTVLFTTDETANAVVAAYDVSNIENPTELDRWQLGDTSLIPHNTHYLDGFLVTSHYTLGVVILDAHRPESLVLTGSYDTSPAFHTEGFHGCWGVYPYFASGNIVASDIEMGLYVLKPTYKQAAYLEGRVISAHTGLPISNAEVELVGVGIEQTTDLLGEFEFGVNAETTVTVAVSAPNYLPDTLLGVPLTSGQRTFLEVELSKWVTGLNETDDAPWSVYPVPCQGSFTISGANPHHKHQVLDVGGRVVFTAEAGSNQITLPANLSNGRYTIVNEVGQERALQLIRP